VILLSAALLMGAGDGADEDFWGNIADPGRHKHRAAMKEGIKYYQSATSRRGAHLSRALLEQLLEDGPEQDPKALRARALKRAEALFKAAVAASPGRARGHLYLGLARWQLGFSGMTRQGAGRASAVAQMKQAVASIERARTMDAALLQSYPVAWKMAIARTSLGELEKAVLEYDRAERVLATSEASTLERRRRRASLLGNTAECLMGLGRLDEAIQRYQEALTLGVYSDAVIHHWGLAVAYDRDEQLTKSMAHARRAVARDRKMSILSSEDVFFVPDGEVYYYRALGHMALGQMDAARRQLRKFVTAQPDSQWTPRAKALLAQLGAGKSAAAGAPQKKRLAPSPGATGAGQDEQDRGRYKIRVQGRLKRIQRCYVEALRKDRRLGGRIRVAFHVGNKGRASRIRVLNATIESKGLRRCLFSELRKISFRKPRSGKPLEVKYTFVFRALR